VVQDGVVSAVRGNPLHAQTDGVLCTKVARYTERLYHPQRLLHPLRRVGPKGSGQFEPVSWDDALADIAAKLGEIAALDSQAVLPYSYAGTMGKVQGEGMAARFFNRLGASRLERTICASAGGEALLQTLGAKVGMRVELFSQSRLILIWGSNPVASSLHFWRYAQDAKRNGARLICIDPRQSETAEKCHQHIALLPGTDAALALGVMHELIRHDWLDHAYLRDHCLGWEGLRERSLQWSAERAAAVCGISADEVRDLARQWGECAKQGHGAAIRLNYGIQRVRGGGNAVRAILCLPALTGSWRHRGGGALLSNSSVVTLGGAALERPDLLPARFSTRLPRSINMSTIGDALLAKESTEFGPSVRAVVVYNSNPVAVAPQSAHVVAGFSRTDLFTVVLEQFQTDTADYADYVLPATMQMEHWDVHSSYGHTDVVLNRPAIAPRGQARSNAEIFRGLARAIGWNEACFNDDDLTLCRTAVGTVVDFDLLLQQGFATVDWPDTPFADGGFPTPSGKCEFYSATLKQRGQDPLPDYLENNEPSGANALYPLAMISPPQRNFLNSSFVNVPSLRRMADQPALEMHAGDAQARAIANGDTVRVFNSRGHYLCVAEVTERARPGVVTGLGVWWRKFGLGGTNVNELTSQKLTDMGNAPTFYDCAVQVERYAQPAAA
jgi:anaerobic selenocysteine-containing dehydrogenase